MKTFLLVLTLTFVQLYSDFGNAFVLPLDTVLLKTSANTGRNILSVEQDVIFKLSGKEYRVREEWLIEGDKNLRLTATGMGELKENLKLSYLYSGKNKTQIQGKNKITSEISREFFEKFLSLKSVDSYQAALKEISVAPKIRLSRAAGSICFAIGEASSGSALSPQIWIDQDFFRLVKMRMPSDAEIEFTDYKDYGGAQYPSSKTIRWGSASVAIQVTKVSLLPASSVKLFYTDSLSLPSEISMANKGSAGEKIEEFYKRFR